MKREEGYWNDTNLYFTQDGARCQDIEAEDQRDIDRDIYRTTLRLFSPLYTTRGDQAVGAHPILKNFGINSELIRSYRASSHRRPWARIELSEPDARWHCNSLFAAFLLDIWDKQIKNGLLLQPPCTWCGLPTGSWCDRCHDDYSVKGDLLFATDGVPGPHLRLRPRRPICTYCDPIMGRCYECFLHGDGLATRHKL